MAAGVGDGKDMDPGTGLRGARAEAQDTYHVQGPAVQNCQAMAPAYSRVGGTGVLPWASMCPHLGAGGGDPSLHPSHPLP